VIAILGHSVITEIAIVEEAAPETGNSAEVIIMYHLNLRPGLHYTEGICKKRFHSEKVSNVFHLHYEF